MPRFSTLIRSTTLRVAGAVAALAVTAPFATPAADAQKQQEIYRPAGCNAPLDRAGAGVWQRLSQPTFEGAVNLAGGVVPVPQEITSYAVGPSDARNVAVTNGNSVYVSRDGGCRWAQGFQLDPVAATVKSVIRGVYIAPRTNAFYALVEKIDSGVTVGTPSVYRSPSGIGGTWREADADDGLPPIGRPLTMRASADASVLYLTFSGAREQDSATCPPTPVPSPVPCDDTQRGERLGLMYASTDGGATWQSRTDPRDLNGVDSIKYFAVDPANGNTVWAVANGLLRRSTDGGRTYTVPPGGDQSNFTHTAVEVLAPGRLSMGIDVVTFSTGREMLRLQGGKWIRSQVPFGAVDSVAQAPEGDIAVTSVGARGADVWRIFPRDFIDFELDEGLAGGKLRLTFGWEGINPGAALPQRPVVQRGDSLAGLGTFYLRNTRGLLRFMGSRLRDPAPPARPVQIGAIPPPRGVITPAAVTLDLPSGKSQTVDYRLTLPAAPTLIEVYLIVDNSGSMQPFIDQLKADLGTVAERLNTAGIPINMGVGQINVQPDKESLPVDDPRTPDVDESEPRPIYRNLRKVGPIDAELFRELQKFDGNAGSGREPQLEALYQAVTGKGMADHPVLTYLDRYKVKPGNDAGFHDELSPIKVIVHATDEAFSRDIEGGHNDPEFVAKVLREADVKQIGLSQGVPEAAKDLEQMARLTGALAPPGGTDCDGDGRIGFGDVKAGQPLVCGQSNGLDSTLVNLIRALKDRAVIDLQAKTTPSVAQVTREQFVIDAKQPTDVRFRVTYTCKGIEPGQYVNDFNAALRGLSIAKATATVNCGGVTTPARPQQPPPGAPGVEPGANPPPPQPQPIAPAPVPVNPVPQPQTQPQVQSQVNPQAGMADQEEEQFQLATADNDVARDQDQLAMVGLSYEDSPGVVLALGMTLASAAGAVALRRRSRTAAAKVTVRR